MKIIKLESENVKRLKAVEISPSGALVVIGGKNAQGKTSVLDSIEYALAGTSSIPSKPIRKGERKARVVVELDDIIVTRTFSESGSKLVVSDKQGFTKSSPQSLLDSLTGKLSFDPLAFLNMKSDEQLKIVRELAGIDFTKLDERKKSVYDERTVKNSMIKTLKGQIEGYKKYEDVPDEEVSYAELLDKQKNVLEHNQKNKNKKLEIEAIAHQIEVSGKHMDELRIEIRKLRKKWDDAEIENKRLKEAFDDISFEVGSLQDKDVDSIRSEIADIEEVNQKVRSNLKLKELQFDLEIQQAQSQKLTDELEAIENEKLNLLSSSKLPIKGLTFDNDMLYYNGVPFKDQSSSAEQLRVSVAMGFSMNPKLKILLIRDGSLLDEDNLKMVAEMADKENGQLWLEKVGEGKECQVIIENGMVKKD